MKQQTKIQHTLTRSGKIDVPCWGCFLSGGALAAVMSRYYKYLLLDGLLIDIWRFVLMLDVRCSFVDVMRKICFIAKSINRFKVAMYVYSYVDGNLHGGSK